MKSYTVGVGSIDAFYAKKRRYSSTAVGFPIRDDLSTYLRGISATFPTWERARLACTYVRNLGICLHWTKNDLLDAILSPAKHAAHNADGARHGLQNSHTAPLFVPAYMIGGRTIHHANTTLATPCGASKLSKRQGNSLLVDSQLAWELLASLLNSHWPNILLTLANHCRPIELTLANYSAHIGEPLPTYSTHIGEPLPSYSTHIGQLNNSYNTNSISIMKQASLYQSRDINPGDVLISIRHKYAERIYETTKVFELRHLVPTIPHGTIMWIYEPMPVGMITGFCRYDGCITNEPEVIWRRFSEFLGVTKDEFFEYYQGREFAFAWCVALPFKLPRPLTLAQIGLTRPPQSYQFLRNLG